MAARLNPYISFQGNAREAMEFYQSVFGGDLVISTFGDMGAPMPGVEPDQVMHAMLETPQGFVLMGADTPDGMPYQPGSVISVSLSGDEDGLRGHFEQLAEGGQIVVPLEKQMWGDVFGQCIDRFGIAWMANISDAEAPEGGAV